MDSKATFRELGVEKNLVKGLKELGIKTPTEVQTEVVPYLLKNKSDLVCQSQTGTGKTAGFGIPLLSKINPTNNATQALVLSPTRELAQQIAKQFFRYTKYTDKIFTEAVFGGEHIDKQIPRLKRTTHIIVATPGRLLELVEKNIIDLSKVQTVVLDEADEMLSKGFKYELNEILSRVKEQANIWLFSATIPDEIEKIIKKYLTENAKKIMMKKAGRLNPNIKHQYLISEEVDKFSVLRQFLQSTENQKGIVFCNTKAQSMSVFKQLEADGYASAVINGDLTQKQRDKVMRFVRNGEVEILVATDLSARGIDIPDVAFVIHYELPEHIDYFIHRSGRTARGGKKGLSLAFILPDEFKKLKTLETELHIRFGQVPSVRR